MIEVIKPGLLDMVMDLGRPGFRAQGVPAGGAADPPAMILANRLVGNPERAAGLELLLRGPILRFPEGGRIALTGADMYARCGDAVLPRGRTLEISPGEVIEFGQAGKGLRAYLAVAGGVDVPPVLGSRATFLPSGFGGWQGRALRTGDMLPTGEPGTHGKGVLTEPGGNAGLRILPGPQLPGFSDAALKALTSHAFAVGPDANRLGLRLIGHALEYRGGELASQAVLPGAIQVPPDGQPIILGWDGPVTGGYPVVAAVIAADLSCLGQLRPGDKLRFSFVTREAAQDAWDKHALYLDEAIAWAA